METKHIVEGLTIANKPDIQMDWTIGVKVNS